EGAIVVGVVPGQAALVVRFLPEFAHELDGGDGLLAVDDDRLAIGLDLLAAPGPQIGIGKSWGIAEGVAQGLADRPALGVELLADLAIGLPGVGERGYSDLLQP